MSFGQIHQKRSNYLPDFFVEHSKKAIESSVSPRIKLDEKIKGPPITAIVDSASRPRSSSSRCGRILRRTRSKSLDSGILLPESLSGKETKESTSHTTLFEKGNKMDESINSPGLSRSEKNDPSKPPEKNTFSRLYQQNIGNRRLDCPTTAVTPKRKKSLTSPRNPNLLQSGGMSHSSHSSSSPALIPVNTKFVQRNETPHDSGKVNSPSPDNPYHASQPSSSEHRDQSSACSGVSPRRHSEKGRPLLSRQRSRSLDSAPTLYNRRRGTVDTLQPIETTLSSRPHTKLSADATRASISKTAVFVSNVKGKVKRTRRVTESDKLDIPSYMQPKGRARSRSVLITGNPELVVAKPKEKTAAELAEEVKKSREKALALWRKAFLSLTLAMKFLDRMESTKALLNATFIYSGPKLLWKLHKSAVAYVFEHDGQDCLEIVVLDVESKDCLGRLYVRPSYVLSFKQKDIDKMVRVIADVRPDLLDRAERTCLAEILVDKMEMIRGVNSPVAPTVSTSSEQPELQAQVDAISFALRKFDDTSATFVTYSIDKPEGLRDIPHTAVVILREDKRL